MEEEGAARFFRCPKAGNEKLRRMWPNGKRGNRVGRTSRRTWCAEAKGRATHFLSHFFRNCSVFLFVRCLAFRPEVLIPSKVRADASAQRLDY